MVKRYFSFPAILTLGLLIVVISASTQSNEEAKGQLAEKEGKLRDAVSYYVAALESVPEDSDANLRLTEKILRIARHLQPPLPLPNEAIRYEGRAEAAIKNAHTRGDYLNAAKEAKKAIRLAPWIGGYYLYLALALEGAGQKTDAIRNLRLALLGSPTEEDRIAIQKKIAGLEYLIEKDAKERTEVMERWNVKDKIAGNWIEGKGSADRLHPGNLYRIVISGNRVELWAIGWAWWNPRENTSGRNPVNFLTYRGTIEGPETSGTYFAPTSTKEDPNAGLKTNTYRSASAVKYSITVSDQGNTMTWKRSDGYGHMNFERNR